MHKTPYQSLLDDREVMEELQDILGSRKKFPRQEEAPGGRAGLRAYLERETPPVAAALAAGERPDFDELTAEAIVLSVGRPSLLVRGGKFEEPELEIWRDRLGPARAAVETVIPSVGRVELFRHPDFEWVGTAWMIEDGVLVTNRHVAEVFAEARGGGFGFRRNLFGQPIAARVDFREEFREKGAFEVDVDEVLFIAPSGHAHPDMALLRLARADGLPEPIGLAESDPEEGQMLGTVGYPARDSRNAPGDLARIFQDIFDVKRFAPGFATRVAGNGHIFEHDCTTLGGASGSPILDLATGRAVGLHFGGRFHFANFAVTAGTVRQVLVRRGFMAVPGRPPAGADEPRRVEDYEGREGYREDFLGDAAPLAVPLPQLGAEQRDRAVTVDRDLRGASRFALDYTHFSVVMNAERRLAFYTAVNVDGNQEVVLRRRNTPWRIDPRIPREAQADNELYVRNRLDRGHLVRRLDPVWGSEETARLADDDSFHYTNAAPQHANLNQRVWLELEDHLLANANQRDLKINVFTGPVFTGCDPEYRGFKIPQEFWKVVAMVAPSGDLHATAYLLSQSRFLDDIEFVFGAFRTFQVPIAQVERVTGLAFGTLRAHDPMAAIEGVPYQPIGGPEDLIL